MTRIRLNRVISQAGVSSLREADRIIRQGRVLVNGLPVTELGAQVDPRTDHITVDGEPIAAPKRRHYYLFFKPKGVVSTMEDPRGRSSIADFTAHLSGRVFPVGRLDWDADGLMLLTDDGNIAQLVMRPGSKLKKTYQVKIAGSLSDRDLMRFARGVTVDGRPTLPAGITPIEVRLANSWYEVELTEGRNRQIKKMFAYFKKRVLKIRRVAIGPLTLEGMAQGEVRKLLPRELSGLRKALGMEDER
jgi:23S rRNA pseudouridine2605 synthase